MTSPVTDGATSIFTSDEVHDLSSATGTLRDGREEILKDWVERVRDNRAVRADDALPDPVLLDHIPHLFDAILDRLEIGRPRDDAEHMASVHGFMRRLDGYNAAETVAELLMFRRAIWAHLTAVGARIDAAYTAMEQIDGMVDRAILSSLQAFLDPHAQLLERAADRSGT